MSSSTLDGLQHTLAAEHAAIWVFGALGGRASALPPGPLRTRLDTALDIGYAAHLRRRDELRTMVSALGGEPVASAPAYRLPSPLITASQIAGAALEVERRCAPTYAALVAVTSGRWRRWAIDALVATAVAETSFGGRPEALPGLS